MFSDRSRINSRKKLIKLKKPAFLVKTKPFNEPLSNERINKIVNKKKTDKIRYTKFSRNFNCPYDCYGRCNCT